MQILPKRYLKPLFLFARLLVTAAIVIYLVSSANFQHASEILSTSDWPLALAAPVLLLAGLFFASMRWSKLLSHFHVQMSHLESYRYYLISLFYSVFLPGVVGGDVVRIGSVRLAKSVPVSVLSFTVILERGTGFGAMMLIGVSGLSALDERTIRVFGMEAVLPLLAAALASILALTAGYFSASGVRDRLSSSRWPWLARMAGSFANMRRIPKRTLLLVMLLGAILQTSDIVGSYLIARSLHITLPFTVFAVLFPLVYVATVLPISLGGLGVREGVIVYFLTRFGVPLQVALAFSFAILANRLIVAAVGGIVQFIGKGPGATHRTAQEPHPPEQIS